MGQDVSILIPRVRRALDGPHATSSGAISGGLTDQEVKNSAADAIADLLLYTGGAADFGYTLTPVGDRGGYGEPVDWETDRELTPEAESAVVAQAALNYFFYHFRDLKVQERFSDEGQSWEYALSPNLLTEQLRSLRAMRDQALESLSGHVALDSYTSYIAVRDSATASLVEPWVTGLLGVGGLERDPRFGTVG